MKQSQRKHKAARPLKNNHPIKNNVCAIITIPHDIIVSICEYLTCEEIIRISETSHTLNVMLMNNELWHMLIIRDIIVINMRRI